MKILITGVAGFIGYHLAQKLMKSKNSVVGIDNLNDYYDVELKMNRLNQLGISLFNNENSKSNKNFFFYKIDITDKSKVDKLFRDYNFDVVVHLAAQAGVRYSLENPEVYIKTNINGFQNIIQSSANYEISKFIYASSSSVYGLNKELPYYEESNTDEPVSLYAATKKSNELIAHYYSYTHKLNTIGLRFFTVYGPWGRPDMAYYSFTKKIMNGKSINLFNKGNNYRDFTYIDDVIESVDEIIIKDINVKNFNIYNLGNNNSISTKYFVEILEKNLGKKSKKNLIEMQKGDVEKTWADIKRINSIYSFLPKTKIEQGLKFFCKWYLDYEKNKKKY